MMIAGCEIIFCLRRPSDKDFDRNDEAKSRHVRLHDMKIITSQSIYTCTYTNLPTTYYLPPEQYAAEVLLLYSQSPHRLPVQ